MKIILSGGGTLGPVTPLLAIYEVLSEQYRDAEFIWIGTKYGPERQLIEEKKIKFLSFSSGKLRRYVSLGNIPDIFRVIAGLLESFIFLKKEKPDLCISAGGFVSVPVHWAAGLLRIPAWVHQQDVRVGLSNKLMAPFAKVITTALRQNVKNFSKRKTVWLGNPTRHDIFLGSKDRAIKLFGLKKNLPVVFVTGGGTGSESVNKIVSESISQLDGVCEVIHLSGKDRPNEMVNNIANQYDYYHTYKFFTYEMKDAYAIADIIISRGGFGTLVEMAGLGKAAVVIPIPGHQEENVELLAEEEAVILVDQRIGSGVQLAGLIKELLSDRDRMENMGNKLHALLPVAKKDGILDIFNKLIKT